jgi:hypothetical protein
VAGLAQDSIMRSSASALAQDQRGAADSIDLAEAALAPLLSFVCSNADLRRRFRLKGASRRADGWPAWYFWFAGIAGAHELALVPPASELDPPYSIEFAIRYFPQPDEDAFETFAPVERAARCSDLFDATGTPAVDAFDGIEPSLFHVATLAIIPTPAFVDIVFAAQDCWLETETAREAAATRRAVRGFELGAPVLDLLVAAHAYCGRRPPAAVEILREPGLRWHVDDRGVAASHTLPELSLWTVHARGLVRFGVVPGDALAQANPPPLPRSRGAECVLRHDRSGAPPRFAGLDLATWHRAASWRFIPTGLFCGCHSEEPSVAGRDEEDAERTCVADAGRPRTRP